MADHVDVTWIGGFGGTPEIIYDSTTYAALAVKPKAIIYGTAAAPTPTGYPDGCFYFQHAA